MVVDNQYTQAQVSPLSAVRTPAVGGRKGVITLTFDKTAAMSTLAAKFPTGPAGAPQDG
jgi:hypothetical protein